MNRIGPMNGISLSAGMANTGMGLTTPKVLRSRATSCWKMNPVNPVANRFTTTPTMT